MTKFRIIEEKKLDGKYQWHVQQWRWLPFPHWSNFFFHSRGWHETGGPSSSLLQAEMLLAIWIEDDRKKRMNRPWNKKTIVVEEITVK